MRRDTALLLLCGLFWSAGCGAPEKTAAPGTNANSGRKSPPQVARKSDGTKPAAKKPPAARPAQPRPERPPVVARRPSGETVVAGGQKPDRKTPQASALEREAELVRYHRLLTRRPLHRTAFEGLVRHYAQQGRVGELVAVYEKRHAAAPDDVPVLLILARLYLRVNRGAEAATLLDGLDRRKVAGRDWAELLAFRARVQQQVGKTAEAVRLMRQAIAETKTIARKTRLVESLADLHLHAHNQNAAAKALTDFAAEYPKDYFHRKRIADALARRKLHAAAVGEYRAVLQLVGDNAPRKCEVLRDLGRTQEAADKTADAIASYTQAINLLSGDHWMQRDLHQRVVRLYRKDNRLKDLIAYCRTQIRKSPTQTTVRELLAEVLLLAGEPAKAKQALADAVRLFPRNRSLSRKRVEVLSRLKDAAGVSAEFQRIIGRYPDDVDLYLDYGRYLAAGNQVEAARRQWRLVLQNKLADVNLANRLGALFQQYDLTDDAVQCYRRAIQLDAKRPEAYAALSRLWFRKRKNDEAVKVLREMTAANPKDAATHARCASLLLSMALPAEALQSIETACRLEPKEFRFHVVRSDLLLRAKKVDAAIAARRKAIDLIPAGTMQQQQVSFLVSLSLSAKRLDRVERAERVRLKAGGKKNTLSLIILSRIAAARGDHAQARDFLQQLLKVDPNHEEGRIRLARLYVSIGNIEAAEAQYRRLIALHPARSRLYYLALVDLRESAGDRVGAVKVLEELARRFPQNASILHVVAQRTLRLEDHERALSYFTRSLERQPGNHAARLEFANSLKSLGRLRPALQHYRVAALQNTDRAAASDATQRLYDVALQLGELDALIDEFRTQVERFPQETQVARVLAEFYIREFDYSKAADFLELILNQNPADVELRLLRGDLNRRLGRFDAALSDYGRALRLPNIDRDYVLAEIGKVHFEAGRPADARRSWNQIGRKLFAGNLLRNNGFRADAVAAFQEGLRARPDSVPLRRQLVHAYETAGEKAKALQERQRLVDLDPDNPQNIKDLAAAYVAQGDRKQAAEVAARLFSLSRTPAPSTSYSRMAGMSPVLLRLYAMYGQGRSQNRVAEAVAFFAERGLTAELGPILERLLKMRPRDGQLIQAAAELDVSTFDKPERALALLKDLETAEFPSADRPWKGQSPQQQHFRMQRLLASTIHATLGELARKQAQAKKPAERSADDRLVLALYRFQQGQREEAVKLLKAASDAHPKDEILQSLLVNLLVGLNRHKEAEPYAVRLARLVAAREAKLFPELREEVQKQFVRLLPVRLQLKIDDKRLDEITHKWQQAGRLSELATLQEGGSSLTLMDGYRVRVTLATIYAKTKRLDEAKKALKALEPKNPADVDAWSTLAEFALECNADDLAFHYYEQAMKGARLMARDPLLERIYGNGLNWLMSWAGERADNVNSLNRILEAFAKRDRLPEFYDYLRESGAPQRARKVVEQFKLRDKLQALYAKRLAAERRNFRASKADALTASLPYFAATCKLAELHDWNGEWDKAEALFEAYLKDFPDEMGLIQTLADVAEARGRTADAAKWLERLAAVQARLSRRRSDWDERRLLLVPSMPQVLAARMRDRDPSGWLPRWGSHFALMMWSRTDPFDTAPTWMRLAKIRIAQKRHVAAADAMQRAIRAAGTNRQELARECVMLAARSRAPRDMLPVYRLLAVRLPSDDSVQMAFARSLERNARGKVAAEVYRRLLRRGIDDAGTLDAVRRELQRLSPGDKALAGQSLADLEAEAAASPDNFRKQFRLARAYFYSLRIDDAARTLEQLARKAPHYPGLDDLLVRVYRVQGNRPKLVAAFQNVLKTSKDPETRRQTAAELFGMLLADGKTDAALAAAKQLVDPQSPGTLTQYGFLLHYFKRDDEAVKLFAEAAKRDKTLGLDPGGPAFLLVNALAKQGKLDSAAGELIHAAEQVNRQAAGVPFGATRRFYAADSENPFASCTPLFLLYPQLQEKVGARLLAKHEKKKDDAAARKLLIGFYNAAGQRAAAEKLLDSPKATAGDESGSDRIARAVKRKDYTAAVQLAEKWLAAHPKPALPAGVPARMAAQLSVASEHNRMIGTIGDLYWQLGDRKKAFAYYRRLVDKNVPESRVLFAKICLFRGQPDEAKRTIDAGLQGLKVKPASLLRFRALLALLKKDRTAAFDDLLAAEQLHDDSDATQAFMIRRSGDGPQSLLPLLVKEDRNLADRYAAHLRQQVRKDPDNWRHYQALIAFLKSAGRDKEAQTVLAQAGRVTALKQSVLESRLLEAEGRSDAPETMIPLYRELIAVAGKKTDDTSRSPFPQPGGQSPAAAYRNRLGDLLWTRGKRDEARKLWLGEGDRRDVATWTGLAVRLMRRGDDGGARTALKEALKLDPEHNVTRLLLAELARRRGDAAAALGHLQSVIAGLDAAEIPSAELQQTFGGIGLESEFRGERVVKAVLKDMSLMQKLRKSPSDLAARTRLVLAASIGDWDRVRVEAERIRKTVPHDPLAADAIKRAGLRRGRWGDALAAANRLEQFNSANLADRRAQLKVLLSGRRNRAASSASATLPSSGAGMSPFSRYRMSPFGRMRGYGGRVEPGEKVSLLMRLKRTQQAEAEVLKTTLLEGSPAALLPLLQYTGRPERALEVARLLSTDQRMGGDPELLARALVKAGRPEEAIELLVRKYQLGAGASDELMAVRAFRYGRGSGGGEDWEPSPAAQQIVTTARNAGRLTATRDRIRERFRKSPADESLGRLSVDLDTLAGDNAHAIATLKTLQKSQPKDKQVAKRLFGLLLQKRAWAEARALAQQTAATASRQEKPVWNRYAALAALLSGDKAGAIAGLKPAGKGAGAADSEQLALLAAAGEIDRALAALDALSGENTGFDADTRLDVRFRLLQQAGRRDEAARVAAAAFWNQSRPQIDSDAWRRVARLAKSPASAQSGPRLRPSNDKTSSSTPQEAGLFRRAPKFGRPEDAALWEFALGGPTAGERAFQRVLRKSPESLDARRGLLLCARLNGHAESALKTADALLAQLKPLRSKRRTRRKSTPLDQRIAGLRAAMNLDSPPVLLVTELSQQSFSLDWTSSLMESGGIDDASEGTYQPLYDFYREVRRSLLLQLGRDEEYVEAVRKSPIDNERRQMFAAYGGRGSGRSLSERLAQIEQLGQQASDIDVQLLAAFYNYRRIDRVQKLLAKRTDADDAMMTAELAAIRGQRGEAERIRREQALASLRQLQRQDSPRPAPAGFATADGSYDRYPYGSESAYAGALFLTAPLQTQTHGPAWSTVWRERYLYGSMYGRGYYGYGNTSEVVEVARRDPAVAKELEKLAARVGPGWEQTSALSLLLEFYEAQRRPKQVLALIDRVCGQTLPPADLLGRALRAAYAAKEYGRIEAAFNKLEQREPQLKPQIALHRVILLRRRGEAAKAAALEKTLLASIKPRTFHAPSELAELVESVLQGRSRYGYPFGWRYAGMADYEPVERQGSDLNSALIRGFGLQIDKPDSGGITLAAVRRQYAAHGLTADALRIIERELGELPKAATKRRWDLLTEKGRLLHKSGKTAEAKSALQALAAEVEAALKAAPGARLAYRLSQLQAMPEFGPDFKGALAYFRRSRTLDGHYERGSLTGGLYLFQSKQYSAAWKEFNAVIQRGGFNAFLTDHLYAAGLSAQRAGATSTGLSLLRQALWRQPNHKWAKQAREIVDGKTAD